MEEIFKISTKQVRDKINIDGNEYELRLSDEFSLQYMKKLSEMGEKIKKLDWNKIKDQIKIDKYITQIISKILIAPKEILITLNMKNKVDIVNFFLKQKAKRDQAMLKFN